MAGTGLSSEIEEWLDIDGKFVPRLSYTVNGDYQVRTGIAGRTAKGAIAAATDDAVTVGFSVEFEILKAGGNESIGSRTDQVTYVRDASGSFKFDKARSTATAKQVSEFYEFTEDNLDSAPAKARRFVNPP